MLLAKCRTALSGGMRPGSFRSTVSSGVFLLALLLGGGVRAAWSQEAATGTSRQVGTVKALGDGKLTVTPDNGDVVTVSIGPDTRVLELPPGSTDLKAAQPGAVSGIAVGDRVLVTSLPTAGSAGLTARRIVVMKSTAIAQKRETDQAGWAHSHSGTVETVDAASGHIMLLSRGKTLAVLATPQTIVRRYATDSARFEDATRGTLADVRVGDQLRVRGEMTGDTVQAAEIVSGTFEQMSGDVVAIDRGASTLTLKDERTKKDETVKIAARTEIHHLPVEMAAQFAARSKAAGHGGSGSSAGAAAGSRGEGDLGQVAAHLPMMPLGDLKVGDAVLLVASSGRETPTAVTVLSGVEPILAASASGGAETSLAPWSVGSGEGAAGATQ